MLTRSSNHTLTEQLAERFAERIRSRLLPAGARLPSVRELARGRRVSLTTALAVLRELDDAGVREIWVEQPPAETAWDGVRDRLSRAAAAFAAGAGD